jgi:hypothetical protein
VNRIEYQGTFWFPVTPPQMWAAIERFDLFESWWAWLADFGADEGGLLPGNVLRGTVVPPVPYRLRLDVRLRRCDRPRLIEAAIGGDLRGRAALRLEAADDGTRAEVAWSLQMHSAPLRVAAHVAYPLMRWGHDHVVDMAVAGFRRRVLPGTPRPPEDLPIDQGGASRPGVALNAADEGSRRGSGQDQPCCGPVRRGVFPGTAGPASPAAGPVRQPPESGDEPASAGGRGKGSSVAVTPGWRR